MDLFRKMPRAKVNRTKTDAAAADEDMNNEGSSVKNDAPPNLNEEVEDDIPDDGEDDEKPPKLDKAAPSRKQPARKRKAKKNRLDDDFEDNRMITRKIHEKFARGKKRDHDAAIFRISLKTGKTHIICPDAHKNVIERAEELKANKVYQIESRANVLKTKWLCCLCWIRSGREPLGDLFGPYYLKVVPSEVQAWPDNLIVRPNRLAKGTQVELDLWMHGECALWSTDLHMKGNEIADLQERMSTFWGQQCAVCRHEGASISIGRDTFVHFPCALKKGYVFDRMTFTVGKPPTYGNLPALAYQGGPPSQYAASQSPAIAPPLLQPSFAPAPGEASAF